MINKPNKIVVHCSDSPHRGDSAKDIHRWHKERGFDGIGYNYVIDENGFVEAGRPHYWIPAHARGHNEDSLAICLIGRDSFNDVQFDALKDLLSSLMLEIKIDKKRIYGHYQLDSSKTCPNFNVTEFVYSSLN
jgi:hypothetical protein